MIPPSIPPMPQGDPEEQHGPHGPGGQGGPEEQGDPEEQHGQHGPGEEAARKTSAEPKRRDAGELQSSPDLQDAPDPSPPVRGTSGTTRKRLVKPAQPAGLPRQKQPSDPPKLKPVKKLPDRRRRGPVPDASAPQATEGAPLPAPAGPGHAPQPEGFRAWSTGPVRLIRRTAVSAGAAAAAGCAGYALTADSGLAAFRPQGVLDPAASLLAPAVILWWLWLPISAGWLAYAVYQWLPRQRTNVRHDWFGWLVLAAEAAAFGWLLAVSAGAAGAAAGVLVVGASQIGLGLFGLHLINGNAVATRTEGLLTDVPHGLVLAAGIFSLTSSAGFILTRSGTDLAGWGGAAWALIGLVTVTMGVIVVCMTDRGHLAVALAAVWGLSCIAVERLTGTPGSITIGASAAGAAFLVLLSAGSRRHQVDHESRWNERRRLDEQLREQSAEEHP